MTSGKMGTKARTDHESPTRPLQMGGNEYHISCTKQSRRSEALCFMKWNTQKGVMNYSRTHNRIGEEMKPWEKNSFYLLCFQIHRGAAVEYIGTRPWLTDFVTTLTEWRYDRRWVTPTALWKRQMVKGLQKFKSNHYLVPHSEEQMATTWFFCVNTH